MVVIVCSEVRKFKYADLLSSKHPGLPEVCVWTNRAGAKWLFFYKEHQWFLFGNIKFNLLKKPSGVGIKKLEDELDRGGVYKTGGFRVVETILKRW